MATATSPTTGQMILDKIVRLMERETVRGNPTKEYFFYITERDFQEVTYHFLMNPSLDSKGRLQGQDGNYSFKYYGYLVKIKVIANLEQLLLLQRVLNQSLELTADAILY